MFIKLKCALIDLMKSTHIKATVTSIVTTVAVASILLMEKYPDSLRPIIGIEVILIPAIYMIAQDFITESVKEEHEQLIKQYSGYKKGSKHFSKIGVL